MFNEISDLKSALVKVNLVDPSIVTYLRGLADDYLMELQMMDLAVSNSHASLQLLNDKFARQIKNDLYFLKKKSYKQNYETENTVSLRNEFFDIQNALRSIEGTENNIQKRIGVSNLVAVDRTLKTMKEKLEARKKKRDEIRRKVGKIE